MGGTRLPLDWFSFPFPCLCLTGSSPSLVPPAGPRAAESPL